MKGLQRNVKVGLALSGGGDCGIAHIGVLKTFERNNIPIDVIAGTSMGAIVGGLYACGYSADSLETLVKKEINWDNVFSDRQLRQASPICERLREKPREPGLDVSLRLSFKPFFLHDLAYDAGAGLRKAQGFIHEISRYTLMYDYWAGFDFDSLPIPFGAIVVNMNTQKTELIRKGTIATTCRASGSLPIVFEPMDIHGMQYVDGGVLDDLPVDAFAHFDTMRVPDNTITIAGDTVDYIIAVYAFKITGKKDPIGSAGVLGIGAKFKTADWARNVHVLNSLARANTGIEIDVKGKFDFSLDNLEGMISKGYEAACTTIDKIKYDIAAREKSLPGYTGDQWPYRIHTLGIMQIKQIDDTGNSMLLDETREKDIVCKTLRISPGSHIDKIDVCDAMRRVYGLGNYEQVSARIENLASDFWDLTFLLKKKRISSDRIAIDVTNLHLEDSVIENYIKNIVDTNFVQSKRALNFEEVKRIVEFALIDSGFVKPRIDSVRFVEACSNYDSDTLFIYGNKGFQLKSVNDLGLDKRHLESAFRKPPGAAAVIGDLKSIHEVYDLKTISVEGAEKDMLLVRSTKKSSHTIEFPSLTFERNEGINFFAEIRARQWFCWSPYLSYAHNFTLKNARELPLSTKSELGLQDCDAKSLTPEMVGYWKRLTYPSNPGSTEYDQHIDRFSGMFDLPFYIANKIAMIPGFEGTVSNTHMNDEPVEWQRFQVMGTAHVHWDNLDRIVFPQNGLKASLAMKMGYLDRQWWERVKIKVLWPFWKPRIQDIITSIMTLNVCGSWFRNNTPEQERFSMGGFTPPGTYQLRRLDYEDLPGFNRDEFIEPIMWKIGISARLPLLEIKLLDIKFNIHLLGALNIAKAASTWDIAFDDLEHCPSLGLYADCGYLNAGFVVNGTRHDFYKQVVWYVVMYGLGF
ncbi:MAG TPA: patatin-like phospholipase family protein [bacterium]